MKTTNKMTVILLMLNHFNLFSKPYISKHFIAVANGVAKYRLCITECKLN